MSPVSQAPWGPGIQITGALLARHVMQLKLGFKPASLTNEPRRKKTGFLHMRKNKDADQLRGNREADQRLCFRYIDSTMPLVSKSEISSL